MDKDRVSKMASTMPANLKSYSKEHQEGVYLEFYSAYTINLTANPKEAEKQEYILAALAEAWGFTEYEVDMLRIRGDTMFAAVAEMIEFSRQKSFQN